MKLQKAILLGGILYSLCLSSISFAKDYSFDSSVVKVNVHQYHSIDDFFYLEQMGSAVHLGSGLIVTNAHVILNSDNEASQYIEICGTTNNGTSNQCGIQAKLMYYDSDIDLALLQVDNKLHTPALKRSNNDPVVSDQIIVKGFPGVGFDTITTTYGSVGGVYKEYYKIDANINGGNSGGGVFKKDFSFVGIPVRKVGLDGIGYIIPVSKVKNFIEKKGNIREDITINQEADILFENYIRNNQKNNNSLQYGNSDFSFSNEGNLKIENVFKHPSGLQKYTFSTAKGKNYVNIRNQKNTNNIVDISDYESSIIDKAKEGFEQVTTGKVLQNNIQRYYVKALKSSYDKSLSSFIYYTLHNNSIINIEITGDPSSVDFKNAEKGINNFTFKAKSGIQSTTINVAGIQLSLGKYISASQEFGLDSLFSDMGIKTKLQLIGEANDNEKGIFGIYENNKSSIVFEELEETDIDGGFGEELVNEGDADGKKGLVINKNGAVFYISKSNGQSLFGNDTTIYTAEGFLKKLDQKYHVTIKLSYRGNDQKKDAIITDFFDNIIRQDSNDFVERSTEATPLQQLMNNNYVPGKLTIDESKVQFKDYGKDTKTRAEKFLENKKGNKIGKAEVKLLSQPSTITAGQEFIIKRYGSDIKSISAHMEGEDGQVILINSLTLDKIQPSGYYTITIPKGKMGFMGYLVLRATTEKSQYIEDISDKQIVIQ